MSFTLSFLRNVCKFSGRYLNEHPGHQPSDIWKILEPRTQVSRVKLRTYLAHGMSTVRLAGAGFSFLFFFGLVSNPVEGSIYLLVLISCARVKSQLLSIDGPTIGVIARFLRFPTGKLHLFKHMITDFPPRFVYRKTCQINNHSCYCFAPQEVPTQDDSILPHRIPSVILPDSRY